MLVSYLGGKKPQLCHLAQSPQPTLARFYSSISPMSFFTPAAAMFYTDISTLKGTTSPTDYGTGVEFADGILNSLFPGQSVGLQVRSGD